MVPRLLTMDPGNVTETVYWKSVNVDGFFAFPAILVWGR